MPEFVQAIRRLQEWGAIPDSRPVSIKDLFQRFQPSSPTSMGSLLAKMYETLAGSLPIGYRTHPIYRRKKPIPQLEQRYKDTLSMKHIAGSVLSPGALPVKTISVKDLLKQHSSVEPHTLRALLLKMRTLSPEGAPHINLEHAHMEPYGVADPVAKANEMFDQRAAAAVYASVNPEQGVRINSNVKWGPLLVGGKPFGNVDWPYHVDDDTGAVSENPAENLWSQIDLLEMKVYGDAAPWIYIPRVKCLAALAYGDYFPDSSTKNLPNMVSDAILAAKPGWCGTYGPGVDAATDLLGELPEGNYDMSQMHLLMMAYRYYDDLRPEAREWLIMELLKKGRIHRVRLDDTFTSGGTPSDWSRAGFVSPVGVYHRLGETENHNITILTARYLTNQLLYQRDPNPMYDNRRNGTTIVKIEGQDVPVQTGPNCTDILLFWLQNVLLDDFSEYNAKPYQEETRYALLNLCSYAYDHEVRLAARMVLDYISAHYVVSSNDLRRMVPFRRRNEGDNVALIVFPLQCCFMNVALVDWQLGADQTVQNFAMQAGNTRIYETPWRYKVRPWPWSIASDGGDATIEALSDYRLPHAIHDLFVNDMHRRFFQRLHRVIQEDVEVTGRNCDNREIYAGSPSYLITAGGSPAQWAIDPVSLGIVWGDQDQQIGVAVTTSFMPTVMPTDRSAEIGDYNSASDLIQFSTFSSEFYTGLRLAGAANYGVAPDFACGHQVYLPDWCLKAMKRIPETDKFLFVDKGSAGDGPGFFLAFLQDGEFTLMEAFDTWLHPGVSFAEFAQGVWERNKQLSDEGFKSNVEAFYTTQNGNKLRFVIWNDRERELAKCGAEILEIEYGDGNPEDTLIAAGNNQKDFLSGTIMNSDGAGVIEISNPYTGEKIILDMSDLHHPKRTSETGEIEEAGSNHEVWVDFAYTGPSEGDFYRPFNTITSAAAAVADGGVIRIMPGWTGERPTFPEKKRIRLAAPIGGVRIGIR